MCIHCDLKRCRKVFGIVQSSTRFFFHSTLFGTCCIFMGVSCKSFLGNGRVGCGPLISLFLDSTALLTQRKMA